MPMFYAVEDGRAIATTHQEPEDPELAAQPRVSLLIEDGAKYFELPASCSRRYGLIDDTDEVAHSRPSRYAGRPSGSRTRRSPDAT
jgi:hypothetical protein